MTLPLDYEDEPVGVNGGAARASRDNVRYIPWEGPDGYLPGEDRGEAEGIWREGGMQDIGGRIKLAAGVYKHVRLTSHCSTVSITYAACQLADCLVSASVVCVFACTCVSL